MSCTVHVDTVGGLKQVEHSSWFCLLLSSVCARVRALLCTYVNTQAA